MAMDCLSEIDDKFLVAVLKAKDTTLRGQALVLLSRKESTKQAAFKKLFNIQSPYGFRNKTLIQNMKIVENKKLFIAREYIETLSKRKDFWNKKLSEEAKRILEKWDERQSQN
jgi:hypothetical protein